MLRKVEQLFDRYEQMDHTYVAIDEKVNRMLVVMGKELDRRLHAIERHLRQNHVKATSDP